MLLIHDDKTAESVLRVVADARLSQLLTARLEHSRSCPYGDFTDLTHILVVEPGDTEAQIRDEVGFSPMINPYDGSRYRSPAFHPFWDWLRALPGFFEMIVAVGNEGYAYVLLIEDADGVDEDLLSLCRTYAQ